jgi:hypothetical protein
VFTVLRGGGAPSPTRDLGRVCSENYWSPEGWHGLLCLNQILLVTCTLSVGRELEAAYLIESSIRIEAGRLRITSKLIRVHDQVQIWSASYDSEPSNEGRLSHGLGDGELPGE